MKLRLIEAMTTRATQFTRMMNMRLMGSISSGDYELFLLSDPQITGGYQIALQRKGRDFSDPNDQMSPHGTLDNPVNWRLLGDTVRDWTKKYSPMYAVSFDDNKTRTYGRLLKLLRIPYKVITIYGKEMLQISS